MSKNYAVKHVGIGSKRYKPGEELPELTDKQWKHLHELGAIRSEYDPVEAEMELADELNQQEDKQSDEEPKDEADGNEPEEADDAEEAEEPQEMPDINVMDGIDEGEEEKPKKRGRKAGKA